MESNERLITDEERVSSFIAAAEYVWDDVENAQQWLTKPHPELAGRTPLEAAKSEDGVRQARRILDCIFYGLPA